MARLPGRALLALLLAGGCAGGPAELTVDVRTDWAPFRDFVRVSTELSPSPFDAAEPARVRTVTAEVRPGDDFFLGTRTAELDGVPLGRSFVRITLLGPTGATVASRVVDLALKESFALTVVLTRNCRDLACPGATDPLGFSGCLDGRCVDPRCSASTPEHCGEPSCRLDGDCATGPSCEASRCIGGVCLCEAPAAPVDAGPPDAGPPDAGPPDAGPCGSPECAPGVTQTDTQPCGNCGSGTQSRTRTCDEGTCRWGAYGSFGACSGASGCAPGSTTGCPNGDACGHRVCQGDCTYGACEPTSQCLRIRPGTTGPPGNNWRCCGTGRWQFCLPDCTWSTDCALCSGCGC